MFGYKDMLASFPSDTLAQRMSHPSRFTIEELAAFREFMCMSVLAPLADATTLKRIHLVRDDVCLFGEVKMANGQHIKLYLDDNAHDIHRGIVEEFRAFADVGIHIEGCGTIRNEGKDIVFVPYEEPTYGKVVLFDSYTRRHR